MFLILPLGLHHNLQPGGLLETLFGWCPSIMPSRLILPSNDDVLDRFFSSPQGGLLQPVDVLSASDPFIQNGRHPRSVT